MGKWGMHPQAPCFLRGSTIILIASASCQIHFFHFSITPCGPVLYFSISVADQRPVVVIIEIC